MREKKLTPSLKYIYAALLEKWEERTTAFLKLIYDVLKGKTYFILETYLWYIAGKLEKTTSSLKYFMVFYWQVDKKNFFTRKTYKENHYQFVQVFEIKVLH